MNEQCSHDDFDSRDDTRAEERAHERKTDGQCSPHAPSRQSGRKRTNSGDHENGRNQQLPDDAGKVCRSVTARCCNLARNRADIQLVTRKCAKAMASPTAKDRARLKHSVRYLLHRPHLEVDFAVQLAPDDVTLNTDSDWATDRRS